MKLDQKKKLAAKALGVGKARICFNVENLAEIKEAITKQDIRDLFQQGIIRIKPEKGKKKIERRKTRRKAGKIKKTLNHRKQIYVKITRKLRGYIKDLRKQGRLDTKRYNELKVKIKSKAFKSKAHLKEHLEEK